jgi:hypothetical protein
MSEKSFAVVSVALALICGIFFYPPSPAQRARLLAQQKKPAGACAISNTAALAHARAEKSCRLGSLPHGN